MPVEKNLMYKAARLFYEKTGVPFSLDISIKKRIPAGAGLGGGSSDAAAVLLILNSTARRPLKTQRLMQTAAATGSDVPFFVVRAPAYVYGRGEFVERFVFEPTFAVLIVKPPFSSDTHAAYTLLDKRRLSSSPTTPLSITGNEALIEAVKEPPSRWPFSNDFQPVFLERQSPHAKIYQTIIATLKDAGAAFTSLSGSGSAVYGIFETRPEATVAVKPVTEKLKQIGCSVWRCTPLRPKPLIEMKRNQSEGGLARTAVE
jgi:4-diphosphocytidyl-2-C-methyl-D-erythritol kinase